MNHRHIVSFIWGVAGLIRDTFKRGMYQDVILPLTVLRRLDCVLAPSKRKVVAVQARFKGKLDNLDPQLRRASGFAFYNTSRYDFEKLLADAPHVGQNLRNYVAGFSRNMREVVEKFDFDNTISQSLTSRASSSRSCSGSATPRSICTPARSTTPPWAPSSRSPSGSSTRR